MNAYRAGARRTAILTALAFLTAIAAGCTGADPQGPADGGDGSVGTDEQAGSDATQTDTDGGIAQLPWISITAGGEHTCALNATDHKIYCWGDNGYGKLGDGTATTYDEFGQIIVDNGRLLPTLVLEPTP